MKNTIDTTDHRTSSVQQFGIENGQQLLSFAAGTCPRSASGRRQILRSRAQGWFDLMRRVVDNAVEWKPAPVARPEQTAFDLPRAA
jgi:hypothetical protein